MKLLIGWKAKIVCHAIATYFLITNIKMVVKWRLHTLSNQSLLAKQYYNGIIMKDDYANNIFYHN